MRDYTDQERYKGRAMEVRWVDSLDMPVQAQGFSCGPDLSRISDTLSDTLWFPEVGFSISRRHTHDTREEAKAAIRKRLHREARAALEAIDRLDQS